MGDGAGLDGGANFFGRISGTPVGVIHREGAGPVENLMPDVVGGADGEAGIARGGMHVDLFERSGIEDLSVGDAVEGDAGFDCC